MTAYVDESLRLTGEGLYVLAAVVVPDARAADVRATLRAAVPPGLRRYHWRKEGGASRSAIVALLAELGCPALAVTCAVDPKRQERARRRCLVRLLWELTERGTATLVFETRGHADASDRRLVKQAEAAGWVPHVDYLFARPDDECLLWLADVVAGAVSRHLGDHDETYAATLARLLTVVRV